ncbi:MAG: hypothetical protein IPM92_05120 [Saprospiraceae bacterium]|nr:hypothetical protein [Saprospiraceae bacterium]
MKQVVFGIFAACILLTACSTGGSVSKGIKGILKRSDCKGSCNKTMDCEGKSLTVEMALANNNIMIAGNTIFARDPDNFDYTIKVEFSSAIPVEMYSDIKNPINKKFVVTGIVEGYDQYIHQVCTRSYILKVSKPEDFKVFTD